MDTIKQTSFGSELGKAVGSSFGQGLEALAQHKMSEIFKAKDLQKRADAIEGTGLFTKQEAKAYAPFADQIFNTVLKDKVKAPGEQALYQSLFGGGQGGQGGQQAEQRPNMGITPTNPNGISFGQGAAGLADPSANAPMGGGSVGIGAGSGAPMGGGNAPIGSGGMGAGSPVPGGRINMHDYMGFRNLGLKSESNQIRRELGEGRNVIQNKRVEEQIQHNRATESLKRESLEKEKKSEWHKVLTESAKTKKNAEKLKLDYQTLIKAANTENYRSPSVTAIMDKLGISAVGRNDITQLIDKVSSSLMASKAADFGAKANQFLEKIIAKSVPGLLNSPTTLKALSEIGDAQQDYEIAESNAQEQYYKAHKNEVMPPEREFEVQKMTEGARAKRDESINDSVDYALAVSEGNVINKQELTKEDLIDEKDYNQFKMPNGKIGTKIGGTSNPRLIYSLPEGTPEELEAMLVGGGL